MVAELQLAAPGGQGAPAMDANADAGLRFEGRRNTNKVRSSKANSSGDRGRAGLEGSVGRSVGSGLNPEGLAISGSWSVGRLVK